MSYTETMMTETILLAPVAAILAGILYLVLRRWRVIPKGKPGIPSFLLLGCSLYVPVFLIATADIVLVQPADLQKKILGRQYASALELRMFSYRLFHDYVANWYYEIDSRESSELHKGCITVDERNKCHLSHDMDIDGRRVSIILDGNRLHVRDESGG